MQNWCTSLVTGRLINLTQVLYKMSHCLSLMSAQMYSYWPRYNLVERSPSPEADRSTTGNIPFNWWYLPLHYHIHMYQPPVSTRFILSMPPHLTCWKSILLLSPHLSQDLPSVFIPPGHPTKRLYTYPVSHTCTSHLNYCPESSYCWTLCCFWWCLSVTGSHKVDFDAGTSHVTESRSTWSICVWHIK